VARVLERVTATVREYEMFSPSDRVVVAVSGGPDSVCLLYSLWMLRRLFKIELEVFHFDHQLRQDSAKDAQYVKRLAAKLRLPFHLRSAEGKPPKGESVEAWARVERFVAGLQVGAEIGARRLSLGHTLDDQAETVLLALMRGGGLEAVSGIDPAQGTVVRPLISVRRSEVEAFCRALRLRPRRDPTNLDTRFLRNAVRLKILPAMEKVTGRDVRGPMARSADLLRSDLQELRPRKYQWMLARRTEKGFELVIEKLRSAPDAGRLGVKLVLRDQLGLPVTKAHIDAVLDLAEGRPGRKIHLPGGFTAVREREYIRIASPESP
jgi:tRNA(Ile)-lysidine synthase